MPKLRKNIFEELDKVKKLVLNAAPGFDLEELSTVLGRLGTQHYKRKGMLLGKERRIYNNLIENGYNPFTVYKWSLLERVPEHVRNQLRNGVIGQKRASRMATTRRRETGTSLQLKIKQQGLVLVRGL